MENRYSRIVAVGAALYWAVFWLMNGLDKFLYGRNLLLFRWHGKDRADQFGAYFERIGIPDFLAEPVLIFTGVWEIALGLVFLAIVYRIVRGSRPLAVLRMMSLGTAASILTFIGFSTFDVVSGDRAELLEHGAYLILVLVSWLAVWMSQAWFTLVQEGTGPANGSSEAT